MAAITTHSFPAMNHLAPAAPVRRTLAVLPLLAALAGTTLSVTAQTPAPAPTAVAAPAGAEAAVDFTAAFARFQQAGAGDDAAIDDAADRFTRLSASHPADPVLRAYAGAATSMRARTTLLPWRKIGHAEDGLALIDKALAQLTPTHDAPLHRGVPAALETRFTAAGTFLALPSMFNRGERGRALLQQVLGSPLFDASPAPFKATVWMQAARQAEADGQGAAARQWYGRVATSGAPQADAARARLGAL